MTRQDRKIAKELKRRLQAAAGESIVKIIFFGSRGRGDAREDSDLDVAIILNDKTVELERRLMDVSYDLMWDLDFSLIISLKIFTINGYQEALSYGFSLYRNIEEEGILI